LVPTLSGPTNQERPKKSYEAMHLIVGPEMRVDVVAVFELFFQQANSLCLQHPLRNR
jgi:hypothetical protein